MSAANQRSQFAILLWVVFVSFVGVSVPYTIFPPLFILSGDETPLLAGWGQNYRNFFLGIALAAYPLGQFFGGPVLGALSDRYGRKKILMFSLGGSVLGYLFTVMALEANALWLLVASRFVTGVFEGNLGLVRAIAASFEHISKYKSLGGVGAAASIGYVIGPLLGGVLSDASWNAWFSPKLPFYLAMCLAMVTFLLAYFLLSEPAQQTKVSHVSILKYFNLWQRIGLLMKNRTLKYLLIVSSVLTLAIDIFYEFGPIYLTARWMTTSTGLALYNGILSLTLALGNGWLAHRLSRLFSIEFNVKYAMLMTATILMLMILTPSKLWIFFLFGLIGFSIAVATTMITVQISDVADPSVQGEVMGTQYGLRMLGDAVVCLIGGGMLITSWALPLVMSSVIALGAFGMYVAWLSSGKGVENENTYT